MFFFDGDGISMGWFVMALSLAQCHFGRFIHKPISLYAFTKPRHSS